ncbi:hypothetical protein [Aliiglaciecola sp. M165]|nr:hypothetical protein [Aliiglaciecola sp. M165]
MIRSGVLGSAQIAPYSIVLPAAFRDDASEKWQSSNRESGRRINLRSAA